MTACFELALSTVWVTSVSTTSVTVFVSKWAIDKANQCMIQWKWGANWSIYLFSSKNICSKGGFSISLFLSWLLFPRFQTYKRHVRYFLKSIFSILSREWGAWRGIQKIFWEMCPSRFHISTAKSKHLKGQLWPRVSNVFPLFLPCSPPLSQRSVVTSRQ